MQTPGAIQELARMFDRLPGVGPRAALRYAYWLAAQPKSTIILFSQALAALSDRISSCQTCGVWTEKNPCPICADPRRANGQLCVVAMSQDVRVMEEASVFQGKYHVLGGLIDPIEGRTPDTLSISRLIQRIMDASNNIKEVILALDPDILGDTTALYLQRQLGELPVSVTRLARGIPTGAQIEYADEATITDAFINRKKTGV
ncbi:MAG: recombination mediator RecR [Patescibacteria group bacterium]